LTHGLRRGLHSIAASRLIATHAVQLVIPEAFHETYADMQKKQLRTVTAFVELIKRMQK
jgi:hypothetical protein